MARGCFSVIQLDQDQFFDSADDLSSVFDSCPGSPANVCSSLPYENCIQVWIDSPCSIQERRANFMQWMGLDSVESLQPDSFNETEAADKPMMDRTISAGFDRICSCSGAVLRSSELLENESPVICRSVCRSDDAPSTSQMRYFTEQFADRIQNFDEGRGLVDADKPKEMQSMGRGDGSSSSSSERAALRRGKVGWLKRLGAVACITDSRSQEFDSDASDADQCVSSRFQRVRVRPYRKQLKEFSALYKVQEFKAHHGAILTMKFSLGGEYLASGCEDGVVRIWKVMECERNSENDIPTDDPSCIYFSVNENSELSPLNVNKEKKLVSKSFRQSKGSSCVVVPPMVFHISEKPLHEFHGHSGDVLDLAWSNDNYLLSSSLDETVRLWKLGCSDCQKVFAHTNYVTCIQFNPSNENFFVSGSIDGKVRIWETLTCRVVAWTDVKEMITAVCYNPDGKGLVVGSLVGDCRIYDASDNHLQLDAVISFEGKRKSLDKRITGLQFCPTNSRKLMATSADSVIRILDGFDVVSKYKGLRNTRSQISATFTSDARYIVSASEDSNVYIWNHDLNQYHSPSSNLKSIWSSEHFASSRVSVAQPWSPRNKDSTSLLRQSSSEEHEELEEDVLSPFSSFTLSHKFFTDFLPRGSATWPEEKLPSSGTLDICNRGKSQFKFMRNCSLKNAANAWGQVIVTAGWDGKIKSFQNFGLLVNP
ncbi:Guanine nucleotide-binding protein subunit beta [Apostasia shenzhenica]|uniref:Guanine nucleotide-binding protein subunit beta n=1 Tax=Apostasia shenzhenica TaxID=1088818 RepID=A0A2I0AD42_9ASPA|nr:Guanine nucleotide-binding protein subunit beta [Apostasia shenzhenica]